MIKNFIGSHPELRSRVGLVMSALSKNPSDRRFKVHKLDGILKETFGASINFKYRITFYLVENSIWFLSIGSHDEVY